MSDWATLEEMVEYSRLSLSTLQRAITQRQNPLPSYLVAGRRLLRKSEFDSWAIGRKPRPRGGGEKKVQEKSLKMLNEFAVRN